MEIFFSLLVTVLFFWLVARALGAIFRGPRWRRRQIRKNYRYVDYRRSQIARDAYRRGRGW